VINARILKLLKLRKVYPNIHKYVFKEIVVVIRIQGSFSSSSREVWWKIRSLRIGIY